MAMGKTYPMGLTCPSNESTFLLRPGACVTLGLFLQHKYMIIGWLTGRDERIRTSDSLNPIYIRTPATTGFQ